MNKITACIISYNEEDKIEDCLKSLKEVADEIVVVDSLSSEATKEIVKKYTETSLLNNIERVDRITL